MTRRLLGALAALLLGAATAAAQDGDAPGALRVVERLHAALEENLAARPARGFAERLAHVEPVVASSFDFDTISRVALGSAWDTLAPAERERLRDLIRRESTLTYAQRFAPPGNGLRFVTEEAQPARGGRTVVRTRLERPSDPPVSLDYVLHETPQGMRIVNVLADGVSDLSLKRAQYAAVIRRDGVAELIRRIEEQVREIAREGAASS